MVEIRLPGRIIRSRQPDNFTVEGAATIEDLKCYSANIHVPAGAAEDAGRGSSVIASRIAQAMKQPLRHRLSKSRIPRTLRSSIYRCQISMSICAGVSLTSSACDRSICPSESARQPKNLLLERCGSIRTAPGHLIERGGSFGKIRQGSRW